MKIAKSSFIAATPQTDGRFWVAETQVFDDGSTAAFAYLCDPSDDPGKIASSRASELELIEPPVADPVLSKLDAAREAYLSGDAALSIASIGVAKELISAKGSKVSSEVDQPVSADQEIRV